jgi:hypothetical protein
LRWVDSSRHFSGSAEQFQRDALGSNVKTLNRVLDVGAQYQTSKQDSIGISIPILIHGQWGLKLPSPTANSPGGPQSNFVTNGLGDIAAIWRHWVLDIDHAPTGNYSIGLGVKFPTGDPHAMGNFPDRNGQNFMSRPADWSIQPGTGGWGLVMDVQGFKKIGPVTAYFSGSYLAEPMNVNGTPSILNTFGLITPANEYRRYNTAADQYLVRLGGMFPTRVVRDLTASIGVRLEGTPANDFIGASDGWRRPGHALFLDPGLVLSRGPDTWSIYTPIAIDRRREADSHGNKGDATFPDYLLLFSYSRRFGK